MIIANNAEAEYHRNLSPSNVLNKSNTKCQQYWKLKLLWAIIESIYITNTSFEEWKPRYNIQYKEVGIQNKLNTLFKHHVKRIIYNVLINNYTVAKVIKIDNNWTRYTKLSIQIQNIHVTFDSCFWLELTIKSTIF